MRKGVWKSSFEGMALQRGVGLWTPGGFKKKLIRNTSPHLPQILPSASFTQNFTDSHTHTMKSGAIFFFFFYPWSCCLLIAFVFFTDVPSEIRASNTKYPGLESPGVVDTHMHTHMRTQIHTCSHTHTHMCKYACAHTHKSLVETNNVLVSCKDLVGTWEHTHTHRSH